jgi:glycosyltransferase involved in cell wall biosynthesis
VSLSVTDLPPGTNALLPNRKTANMNLLTVIHYPVFSGPHNRVLRISRLLAQNGWESFVVIPDDEGNAATRLQNSGCSVIQMPLRRLREKIAVGWVIRFIGAFRGDIRRLREVIRSNHIDLVLIGGLVNPHGAIAAKLENVPVVWQIIDSRNPAPIRRLLMPIVLRLSNGLMFGGKALIELHLPSKQPPIPIAVCPPSVDTEKFIQSLEIRRSTRESLGIPVQAAVVGMVANLNPQKGIEFFVRAAAIVSRQKPETYFLLVGATYETHAAYTAFIEEEIKKSGIADDRFVRTGSSDAVELLYPAMDVKLITSVPRSEGTTTTAMEAMSCGIPVVAADVGAVKEVVLDGQTGMIVPPMDPAAIADATLNVLNDSKLAARLGKQGRQWAIEQFDIKVGLARYLALFEDARQNFQRRQNV